MMRYRQQNAGDIAEDPWRIRSSRKSRKGRQQNAGDIAEDPWRIRTSRKSRKYRQQNAGDIVADPLAIFARLRREGQPRHGATRVARTRHSSLAEPTTR